MRREATEWKGQGMGMRRLLPSRVGPCGLLGWGVVRLCADRGGYTVLYSSTSTGYNLPGYGPPGRPSEVPPAVILAAELAGDSILRQSRNMKW